MLGVGDIPLDMIKGYLSFAHVFKGVIWCDFMFSFVFGVLQAVCAYISSVKLQRLKSQNQRDILYKS